MEDNNPHKNKVHHILTQSYAFYFLCFMLGVCLNLIFNFKIFHSTFFPILGFTLLPLGTVLILWAQGTSRNLKKGTITRETFCSGPYRFTRVPTHLGLFLLMLGLGMVLNSPFIILFAFISFIFGKILFLNKQEKVLTHKYGDPYIEYKKLVKF